jgi:hypothetical protein
MSLQNGTPGPKNVSKQHFARNSRTSCFLQGVDFSRVFDGVFDSGMVKTKIYLIAVFLGLPR